MNVLIVEDEKMIRQGIKTMIQRSGFQIDMIIECMNGEMALELLKKNTIDIMFTDIHMPKMNGIELVKEMQQLQRKPLTVAISGYDEFSYAVELMHYGVRDYILKPIEREKIQVILGKLVKEIEENKNKAVAEEKISVQQFKYFMLNKTATKEEWNVLQEQYGKEFYEGAYYVCCFVKREVKNQSEASIYIHDLKGDDLYIVEEDNLAFLQKNELESIIFGISKKHYGLKELSIAYEEAYNAKKHAFCKNYTTFFADITGPKSENKIREQAMSMLSKNVCTKNVHILGLNEKEVMEKNWKDFFSYVEQGYITPEEFEVFLVEFLEEAQQTYRHLDLESIKAVYDLENIFQKEDLCHYKEVFFETLKRTNEEIIHALQINKSTKKMKQAVEYIHENYMKDLNMAVVSNYISMNYSLFSSNFKEYTGSNFVNYLKDIRMKEAEKLLTYTNKRIIEISQEIGYENEKHFMKVFKTTYGVSPSEYRKNTKN